MKHYLDYKKLLTNICLISLIFIPIFFSNAQSISDLQKKIYEKDNEINKLEEEINFFQKEIDYLSEQKKSLNNVLKQLDINKKKLNTDINITEKKIDKTNLKIENLNSDINIKKRNISNNTESIKLDLKKINEFEQDNILENLLKDEDFSIIWNDIDNMISVREKIRKNIINLKEVKNNLENTKDETIVIKNELLNLKNKLKDQQKIVIQNTNEKNKILKLTKNNEANYQKLLKERILKRDAFEKELRDYEDQLQFILDPSKLPKGRVLSWPLEKVFITQLFGKTVDSKRLYASGTHNGVDFRASIGTPILAMADGKILGIGDTDLTCKEASFGKFIFIKYNNGLSSTFGHLSLIKVSEGQEVKRGEVVGYSGNTGHSTGPHLHVSLYASEAVKMESRPSKACEGRIYRVPISPINAYLDVMNYLPPYKK